MKAYEALYNPMIHESTFGTLSVHFSKEGAEKAIAAHKEKAKKKWLEMYKDEDDADMRSEFGTFESWHVNEIEILP